MNAIRFQSDDDDPKGASGVRDMLRTFASESLTPTTSSLTGRTAAAPTENVPLRSSRGRVSLAQMRACRMTLEWYEAIALVQAVCVAIVEQDPIGPTTVDPSDIQLESTGYVHVNVSGPRDQIASVQRLGGLLTELLPERDFMFLRPRIVERATCSPPLYRSIHELSQALEYYERPNRTELLRGIYNRWQALPPSVLAAAIAGPSQRHDGARQLLKKPADNRSRRWSRVKLPAIAIALFAAALAVAAFVTNSLRSTEAESSKSWSSLATEIIKPFIASRKDEPLDPGPAEHAAESEPAAKKAGSSKLAGRSNAVTKKSSAVVTVGEVDPTKSPRTASGTAASAPTISESVTVLAEDSKIYDESDADVVPPVIVYPQTIEMVRFGAVRQGFVTFEAFLNEEGGVDSVRASRAPRTLAELNFVTNAMSAAKSWRFHPAFKDGQPVRYRQLVALPLH